MMVGYRVYQSTCPRWIQRVMTLESIWRHELHRCLVMAIHGSFAASYPVVRSDSERLGYPYSLCIPNVMGSQGAITQSFPTIYYRWNRKNSGSLHHIITPRKIENLNGHSDWDLLGMLCHECGCRQPPAFAEMWTCGKEGRIEIDAIHETVDKFCGHTIYQHLFTQIK